ncbi:histidine phosphatase family protein [Pseudomonas putida]|uniref:Histidine phosphatase family protein n=1 Tax=Pseudomonas putida TaxID=303 RepID=A0A2Z4RCD4_PSEPU|nr:histidine phosphatase family protein [Pseudomonas putida]AWY38647.1 histidine phosphatase family protein [Pseudomonas putida]
MSAAAIMRRRCYLVRHGHVNYFSADGQPLDPRSVPLSDLGVEQVRQLAQVIEPIGFDRALCSDYPRARQTAEGLLGDRQIELQACDQLREVRAGRLRDIAPQQLQQQVGYAYDSFADPEGRFMGGERWSDFAQRVLTRFDAVLAEPDWQSLLLVSHDAVNRLLLGWALGGASGCAAALEQDNACLNIIDIDMQAGRVLRCHVRVVNLTPYDLAKTGQRQTVMERIYAQLAPLAERP